MGLTTKATQRQPQLIFRLPAGFPQRVRRQDQHPAGEVLLPGIGFTVFCAEQVQLCQLCPVFADESVQHGGVAIYEEGMPVSSIFGDKDGSAPLLIVLMVAAVIGLLLQGVGQHKAHPLVAILVDNAFGAVGPKMHPVKALADGQLYGPGAGTVGAEIGTPQLQLAPLPSLFGRVGVHRLTRQHRQCLLPPKAAPVQTGSIHSA